MTTNISVIISPFCTECNQLISRSVWAYAQTDMLNSCSKADLVHITAMLSHTKVSVF